MRRRTRCFGGGDDDGVRGLLRRGFLHVIIRDTGHFSFVEVCLDGVCAWVGVRWRGFSLVIFHYVGMMEVGSETCCGVWI